jgi:NADPH-dependent 2,4-dienoyl-CoA reductase/sulfur reductase-like enzyme/bacterioferritin-associated ferredoxin
MAAAIEARQLGIETILIDSAPALGGQVYRQTPPEFADNPEPAAKNLIDKFTRLEIPTYQDTMVWGIFQEEGNQLLCLYGPDEVPRRILAKTVILATGAYERPAPFPGWTLPGVMTVGAALIMVKHQHILPGRRIMISGTGPLQWVLAHKLIDAGAETVQVLDANPFPWHGLGYLPRFWGQGERLREGFDAFQAMWRSGQSVRWGQMVLAAHGENRVETVTFGRVDGSNQKTIPVDTICMGYGFIPAVQLSCQAGCEHIYAEKLGGWIPKRSDWLETTIPGVFSAGDGAGIGGKDTAFHEGQLAALGAAQVLGKTIPAKRAALVRQHLARQKQFAEVLNTLFPFPAQSLQTLTNETYLCRCEGVRVSEVRQMILEGATTLGILRKLTRAGMGRCQGRFCGPTLAALLSQQTGQPLNQLELPTPRPPVMPIPLHGLGEEP